MKTIVKSTIILMLCIATKIVAQTPPATPKTKTISTTESTSSYSYSHSDDDTIEASSSSSVSVKRTSSTYKLRASFGDERTAKIKEVLEKELSAIKNISTEKPNRWSYYTNDEKVFECKLSEGHLRMFLDKELSGKKMENKIIDLGEKLKHLISNGSSVEASERNLAAAKEQLKQAEKEYKRAQKNLKKAQQN